MSIPTANAFSTLAEFQISCNEGFRLQPPIAAPNATDVEDAINVVNENEIDEAFLQALGVIHHNPHLSFEAEMSDIPKNSPPSPLLTMRSRTLLTL
ncbi:hypothetical protein BVRB_4g084790 [Beta vulgaris subsp. vulgaris]|nr:hypothetical protein BVRB_4g084790 [Beta vulgaris subsp. vulgaris]